MRLVQLNVWGGRLSPQIGDLFAELQPDIACLQEAISLPDKASPLFVTTQEIQRDFNLSNAVFAPTFSFNFMHGTAQFGNGILSNSPISASKVVFTHSDFAPDYQYGEASINIRNFVHAQVNIEGTECHVITHHGYRLAQHKDGNSETLRQMDMVADYLETLSGPIILTGDFNLAPTSPSLGRLNVLLTNLSIKAELKTTRTNLTHKTETCDYIFVSPEVIVKDFKALATIVSDHQALLLDFTLGS